MATDAALQVHYPESDGEPMGETDLHRAWMFHIIEMLQWHVRGQRTYVTGDLLFYYVEGDPKKFLVPDAMVVKDCDPGMRRTYKLWEEQRVPCFILETTSQSTKAVDLGRKWRLYAELGVAEYFMYDPTGDYIPDRLRGHRLVDGVYQPMAPDAEGRLESTELGLWLRMEEGALTLWSIATGERILTGEERFERERARAEAVQERAEAERTRAEDAEQRAAAAEAEAARLREELRRLQSRQE